ncbi:MAG: hypothetical protein IT245_03275, partial [Bacteroidia bacterium]|nr:hypothetical protein [Bacteroidia bacterium]
MKIKNILLCIGFMGISSLYAQTAQDSTVVDSISDIEMDIAPEPPIYEDYDNFYEGEEAVEAVDAYGPPVPYTPARKPNNYPNQ